MRILRPDTHLYARRIGSSEELFEDGFLLQGFHQRAQARDIGEILLLE